MQTDEEKGYLKLCELAKELIAATPDRIRAEGLESFCEICESAKEGLLKAKPQVGRGRLAVDLGLKVNDIREHSEKYRESSPKPVGTPEKPVGKVHPNSSGGAGSTTSDQGRSQPNTQNKAGPALPAQPDEDDAPW